MKRSDRMQPLQALAEDRERGAGRASGQAKSVLEGRERQLEQLRAYLADYQTAQAPGTGAIDPMRLQNYHAFLARLKDAIRQQEQLVTVARAEYERTLETWRERRVESASMGKAVERMRAGEAVDQARRDQAEMDEFASRRLFEARRLD